MKKFILLSIVFALLSCVPSSNESNYTTDSFYWDGSFPPPSLDYINLSLYNQIMPDYYGYIIDVADGDTFYVDWFSEDKMGVRVKGIDTPETVDRRSDVQYWGPEASAYAKSILTPGTLVRLKFEGNITGPFGRLLAYVWYWNGQEWIYWNQQVLEAGMAFVYIDYEFEYPNEFLAYQQYAMENELGMWSQSELIENEIATTKEEFAEKESWYRRNYYY